MTHTESKRSWMHLLSTTKVTKQLGRELKEYIDGDGSYLGEGCHISQHITKQLSINIYRHH